MALLVWFALCHPWPLDADESISPGETAIRMAIVNAVRERMGQQAEVTIDRLWAGGIENNATTVFAKPDPGSRLGRPVRFGLTLYFDPAISTRQRRSGHVTVELSVKVEHTRAARAVARGVGLSAADIETSNTSVPAALLKRLPRGAELIGATTTRDLRPGDVIEGAMVVKVPLVKSGDTVTVRTTVDGIEAARTAKASQRGDYGEIIRLVVPGTRRVLRGRVVGSREVEVLQ